MFRFLKRKKVSVLDYNNTWWGKLNTYSFLFLMYVPLLIIILFSFNDSKRNILWRGFTTKYWGKMWNNYTLWDAMYNSLIIAFVSMIFSVILAVLTAYALERYRFFGRGGLDTTVTIPLIVPEISFAVMLMMFFLKFDITTGVEWPYNLNSLIIAHTAFSFPFATMIIRARLSNFDMSLEEAAKDMGANQWQVLRHIVVPYLNPAIVSSALLSFIMSLDDFVVTFFVSRPDTATFPLYVYSSVKMGLTPAINAASTVLIIGTVILLLVSVWIQKKTKQEFS